MVIQGYPYWCQQKSRTVCCRNVQLMRTLFLKLTKIWQRENGKFVDFNDPTQVWTRPSKKPLRISTNDLSFQELDLLTYISAADSVRQHSLVLRNYVWKSNPVNLKLLVRKQNFTCYTHSSSLYVTHFAISYRATRGSISPYNIAGLISEVSKDVATQIAKNCRRQQPHSHLRPPPRGTPRVFAYTLYFQKLESSDYIFVAACMGLSLFKFVQWPPKRGIFSEPECVLAVQGRSGSSKVDDFGTNRKRVATSY